NEEMETAKEELQSANEELTTLNEELQNRNSELSFVNNDLTNLLNVVQIPILMLGTDLRIRRFTPAAEKLNLIPSDIGRPVTHVNLNFNLPSLEKWLIEVIENVQPRQHEVQDHSGHWFDLHIRPYKTLENKIDGAVVIFTDIHEMKENVAQLQLAKELMQTMMETIQRPLLILSKDLRVKMANRAFYGTFQVSKEV